MYHALRVLCRPSFSERRNSMLVFIVCDITQANRARATVCKAGPILGIRRMNRCKGRVQSTPRVTARITNASVMPTTATNVAYLASPTLPTSPNPNGSIGFGFEPLMNPHDPDQESDDRNGQEQFDGRPGDGRQEVPPQRDLILVVIGQLFENFAEVARLLAHLHHFAEQGRKEIARGGQPLAEGSTPVDRLADGRQVPAGRGAAGVLRLASADRPFIDTGQQAHRRPLAEGGKLLERHSRAEKHDGRPPWVESLPSLHCTATARRHAIGSERPKAATASSLIGPPRTRPLSCHQGPQERRCASVPDLAQRPLLPAKAAKRQPIARAAWCPLWSYRVLRQAHSVPHAAAHFLVGRVTVQGDGPDFPSAADDGRRS